MITVRAIRQIAALLKHQAEDFCVPLVHSLEGSLYAAT